MKTFLMICAVAAEFLSNDETEVFKVPKEKIGSFIQAPEWVRETLLFKLLVKDGSIRVAQSNAMLKSLENDPLNGLGADGKALDEEEPAETTEAPEAATEAKTTRKRTRKAKDDAE